MAGWRRTAACEAADLSKISWQSHSPGSFWFIFENYVTCCLKVGGGCGNLTLWFILPSVLSGFFAVAYGVLPVLPLCNNSANGHNSPAQHIFALTVRRLCRWRHRSSGHRKPGRCHEFWSRHATLTPFGLFFADRPTGRSRSLGFRQRGRALLCPAASFFQAFPHGMEHFSGNHDRP